MPKTTNAAARTHLGLNSGGTATDVEDLSTTLAVCWKLTRRDGTAFFLTNSDKDVTLTGAAQYPDFEGVYQAAGGFDRSAITAEVGLKVPNMEIVGLLNSTLITENDVRNGLYDFARVDIFRCNWQSPDSFQLYDFRGRLDSVTVTQQGIFVAELRGLADVLNEGNMLELYGPECLADLGDSRCGIPVEPDILDIGTAAVVTAGEFYRVALVAGTGSQVYNDKIFLVTTAGTLSGTEVVATYDVSVGATVADGTASLEVQDAWSRTITVATVVDRKTFTVAELTPETGGTTIGRDYFPNDSMNGGAAIWESGNNTGAVLEIKDFAEGAISQTITLHLDAAFDIEVGDVLRIYRGCDKRLETCRDIFDNVEDFRGFGLYTPGTDALLRYPDA